MGEKETEPKKVEGFAIVNPSGNFLTGDGTWYDFEGEDFMAKVRVFTRDEVESVIRRAEEENWKNKPVGFIKATYREGAGASFQESEPGKLELTASELPPLEPDR